jgi:hypothetical protein
MSFEGASSRRYEYDLLNLESRATFPLGGGNFIFTRPSGQGLEIVCAGENESLWNVFVFTALWHIASTQYGATAAHIQVNADERARQVESWDLVRKHRPVMNVDFLGEHALALSVSLMTEMKAGNSAEADSRIEWALDLDPIRSQMRYAPKISGQLIAS